MAESRCDLLVIGAGPAGIAAAVTAVRNGAHVALYDMQAEPGGQIWRGEWCTRRDATAAHWMSALENSNVAMHLGRRLIAVDGRRAHFDGAAQSETIQFSGAVIATGARELLLPFPGWTVPGVFGAGGLQALAKNGWPISGKRVVVAGSGPLLLAAAASLRAYGADVRAVVEQASWSAVCGFAPALLRTRGKFAQALGLATGLRGVPYCATTQVVRAHGEKTLAAVTLRNAKREWQIDCDYLACGYGLVPNLDVAQAFGCAVREGTVFTDADQRSSVAGIYCAGEGTGIGGVDQALAQGEIAGFAATGRAELAVDARRRLASAQRFAAALRKHFALGREVLNLAADDTVLCRCEDVSVGAARACSSQREAKLHTRLGMGHCQGRVCGAAASALFGWSLPPPRLPLAPVRVGHLDLSFPPTETSSSP